MAFHFTLNDTGAKLEIAQNSDEMLSFVDFAYSDDGTTYKAMVTLCSVPGMPPSHREIHFAVLEARVGGSLVTHTDGRGTKKFLLNNHRTLVLKAIADVVVRLVKRCDCEVLVINTIETNLPQAALEKYDYVCYALCQNGYKGRRVDSFHGQEQWQLEKIDKT